MTGGHACGDATNWSKISAVNSSFTLRKESQL